MPVMRWCEPLLYHLNFRWPPFVDFIIISTGLSFTHNKTEQAHLPSLLSLILIYQNPSSHRLSHLHFLLFLKEKKKKTALPNFIRVIPSWADDHTSSNFLESFWLLNLIIGVLTSLNCTLLPFTPKITPESQIKRSFFKMYISLSLLSSKSYIK